MVPMEKEKWASLSLPPLSKQLLRAYEGSFFRLEYKITDLLDVNAIVQKIIEKLYCSNTTNLIH